MKAIYLPEYDAIWAAIPLYQKLENEIRPESFALNNYPVTISVSTYGDQPLAYCISNHKQAFVISQEHYLRLVKKRLVIELGEM